MLPDSSPPNEKGKGRQTSSASTSTNTADSQCHSSPQKPSLTSSLFGAGTSSDIPASLMSLLTQSKEGLSAGQASALSCFEGSSTITIATEHQLRPPLEAAGASTSNSEPRGGFRTRPVVQTSLNTPLDQVPASKASLLDTQPRYTSSQALDAALHEAVRRELLAQGDADLSSLLGSASLSETEATSVLSQSPCLDPAYHEAWARSISTLDLSAGSTAPKSAGETAMNRAWERTMLPAEREQQQRHPNPWAQLDAQRPRTQLPSAEQGGLMALLDTEEAEEAARLGIDPNRIGLYTAMTGAAPSEAREADPAVANPPPDLASLRSTDPREALAFILNDVEEVKQLATRKLDELKRRLEGDLAAPASKERHDAAANSRGLDVARRRGVRRALAQIEYDAALLEQKLGYAEDVWINEARDYPPVPDFARVGEDEEEDREEELSEGELGVRRRRAIERLESLRRHLEAKL